VKGNRGSYEGRGGNGEGREGRKAECECTGSGILKVTCTIVFLVGLLRFLVHHTPARNVKANKPQTSMLCTNRVNAVLGFEWE
jgi:hypothetical protein